MYTICVLLFVPKSQIMSTSDHGATIFCWTDLWRAMTILLHDSKPVLDDLSSVPLLVHKPSHPLLPSLYRISIQIIRFHLHFCKNFLQCLMYMYFYNFCKNVIFTKEFKGFTQCLSNLIFVDPNSVIYHLPNSRRHYKDEILPIWRKTWAKHFVLSMFLSCLLTTTLLWI